MKEQKYPKDPVERFMQVVANRYIPPVQRIKTLTGIAYNMSLEQIEKARQELRVSYQGRLRRLEEIGAPQIIIDGQNRLLDPTRNTFLRILELAERKAKGEEKK